MSNKTVRIRMYHVGFGDCFLIILPDKRTILIDAGFHGQGKGEFSGNALPERIRDDLIEIRDEPRIDVVIATHRHQDHIYSFNSENWGEIEIGEVWLPWVEDRSNPDAKKLWKKQQSFAMNLAAAAPMLSLSAEERENVEFLLWNAGVEIGVSEFAVGGWSNAGALDTLHEGFARRDRTKPRFLPESLSFPETFETPVLPNVKVHVLGPPRDADLIEHLDPASDGETYKAFALAASAGLLPSQDAACAPFGPAWQVPDTEVNEILPLDGSDIERLKDLVQKTDALFAATKVDGMINSTSLVLVLEIGKARLLFPGDAEWGTWKRILDDEAARTLLKSCTFLKVGHHGSHNATAKTLVEKVLPSGIPALMPTQEGPGKYRSNIPLKDLLDALKLRGITCIRSDRGDEDLPDGFEGDDTRTWTDLEIRC